MAEDLGVEVASGLSAKVNEFQGIAPGGLIDLWSPVASVTVEVTNSGSSHGSTVPQLYISFPQDTTPEGTPAKVLRGFEKAVLEAGDESEVKFELLRRDLSHRDTLGKERVIPEGGFTFMAGFSSKNLKAEARVRVLE